MLPMLLTMMVAFATNAGEVLVRVDAQTVALIFGFFTALIAGLLSKMSASSGLKAVINLLLSGIGGVLAAYTQDGFFESDLKTIVLAILSTWVVSVGTYYGLWKPTGVAGSVIAKTASFGFGPRPVLETDDKGAEEMGEGLGTPGGAVH